jgi:hypothetical protein
VKNKEVLQRVEAEKNTLHTIKRRKAKRNSFLNHVIECKIERRARRGRRRKQLLDDLQ